MAPLSEICKMLIGQAFGSVTMSNMNFAGKTIVVTGANTGLGLACLKHLARLNASHIVLACRDIKKGEAAVRIVQEETGCKPDTKLEVWNLDLSSYESVLSFSKRVSTDLVRLDAFIANAGVEVQTFEIAENIEKHLAVNVVSTFISAIAALPTLQRTSTDYKVQTVLTFCGSMYHIFGPDEEFDRGLSEDVDMFDALSDPQHTDIIWRYALSKLMVHQCFHELVARIDELGQRTDSGVITNIINPGWCATELSRAKPSNLGEKFCFALIGWTAEKGSRAYVHALTAGRPSHGKYISEGSYKAESRYVRSARGRRVQAKMWKDLMIRVQKEAPEVAAIVS